MRKILGISLCLLLLVAAIVAPTVSFAAESTANAGVTIHFLNPTAIAIAGDSLFVADNVDKDSNKSVILSFTLGENEAIYRNTIEIDGNVTNLSGKGDSGLYAVLADKVIEYTVSDNAALTYAKEYNEDGELKGFVDCVYGQSYENNQAEYFLAQQGLYRNADRVWAEPKVSDYRSCVVIGDYIYYLQINSDGKAASKRFNGRKLGFDIDDVYNNGNGLASQYKSQPLGLFAWGENVGVYWNDKIHFVEIGAECSRPLLLDYNAVSSSEENLNVKDVEASDGKLFVLNDKNVVEVYANTSGSMSRVYTVGSDTVEQAVPYAYSSFTLVRSKGYPSNLVFKTNDEQTTIPELMTDADEYIILGYAGSEESLYYYVLTNDNHFGWVKKTNAKYSDGKLVSDDKLEIVDTSVSRDGNVNYKTVFASLNAVYIYKLPRSVDAFCDEVFKQTASTMPEVTVKQRFTEKTEKGETVWYFVSYEVDSKTMTGFVKEKDLGEFMPTPNGNVPAIDDKKINSTLFEAVKLYKFPDKDLLNDEANLVTTADGPVKLYSGRRVTLISEEGDFAFIQIQDSNGTNIYGYVLKDRLIGIHAITTNAAVGLSVLAVAIALATTLIIVFLKRKKGFTLRRKKENKTDK